ncbi:MAG: flagellar assembly protein FliH [Firmicutes bacterium]|nr:flagellar assembly protein FliH [Bacillota bacterium]
MIQIVLSYKIIKNTSNREEREKHLSSLDLEHFRIREEALEEESPESDPAKSMEAEIRRDLMEETARKRKALLEKASEEAEAVKEAARLEGAREGYSEGFRKGFEEGRMEAEGMRENAVRMAADAENIAREYFEECEERILSLSVRIAEKIVHQAIDSNPENIMLLARPILQEYGKTENVVITCNPENSEKARKQLGEMEKLCPNARILILEDRCLEKNGLIIENENQITDLQIGKQLEKFLELAKS